MSGAVTAIVGIPVIGPVIIDATRAMGTIIPDCAIEERHTDRLRITDHPVETGVVMSDHAYMLPNGISLRYGFSNAILPSTLVGIANSIEKFGTGEFNVQIVYEKLLDLQNSREPFTLVTGKRVYQNMLIEELEVTTDQHSEYALMVTAHCREVIIVSTQSTRLAPTADQDQPQDTGAPIERGPVQQSSPLPTGSNPVPGGSALSKPVVSPGFA